VNLRANFSHVLGWEIIGACTVFGLIVVTLLFALLRSKTRWGRHASGVHEWNLLEGGYAVVITLAAVSVMTLSLTADARTDHKPPAVRVTVTGYQWCWRFSYQGTPVSVTANCVDGHTPTLVLPVGETVRLRVTSADVIHAFWVPYLRFKTFAYPNYVNSFETSIPTVGSWPGRCSEFCGLYHYAMDFTVRGVTPAAFRSWLHTQEAAHR
jgi:cytochrome c oxidase subunit 2